MYIHSYTLQALKVVVTACCEQFYSSSQRHSVYVTVTKAEVKVQSTSSFISSSCNSFLYSPPSLLLLSAVDLVLFSVSSREGTEGDRDEGNKQLIERRDKVDIGQSVCACDECEQ